MSASSNKIQEIKFIAAEKQAFIASHNAQNRKQAIPQVLRNADTGWPLLQISSFEKRTNQQQQTIFRNRIQGEKCQDMFIGGFSLAKLLAESPATKRIKFKGNNKDLSLDKMEVSYQPWFASTFSVQLSHRNIGYKLEQRTTGYGKALKMERILCGKHKDYAENLLKALSEINSLAFVKGRNLILKDNSWSNIQHSENEIFKALNRENAIFHNGQIHVDLGRLLTVFNVDDEQIALLNEILGVDNFKNLKEKESKLEAAIETTPQAQIDSTSDSDSLNFSSSSSSSDESSSSSDDDALDEKARANDDLKPSCSTDTMSSSRAEVFKLQRNTTFFGNRLQRTTSTMPRMTTPLARNKNN
jgi:hypothetical protein